MNMLHSEYESLLSDLVTHVRRVLPRLKEVPVSPPAMCGIFAFPDMADAWLGCARGELESTDCDVEEPVEVADWVVVDEALRDAFSRVDSFTLTMSDEDGLRLVQEVEKRICEALSNWPSDAGYSLIFLLVGEPRRETIERMSAYRSV